MLSSISNYYERLVLERLHEVLKFEQTPLDDEYIDDLACVALNYLPTRYIRHSVDFTSHLSDSELKNLHLEVADAVSFAMATMQRRTAERE
ncbi:competence protein ComFB [Chromatium weissei]|nr:competence protein ComFB [Chromatium weissei]